MTPPNTTDKKTGIAPPVVAAAATDPAKAAASNTHAPMRVL
jgi:hypothetical protein